MKKPNIPAISFIKGISAMGVVFCHFFVKMVNMDTGPILTYANGYWGGAWVQTFLIVSGFLLHYHYSDHIELKTYAIKRWRSIFPMFYIAYLFFMYGKVCDWRSIFYYGHPWAYLLTLLGMDGYTMGRLPAYYIIGEWFLGVIIILYILYPLLRKAYLKNATMAFLGTVILYGVFYDKPITNELGLWTVSSCMVSFSLGMFLSNHRDWITGKWGAITAVVLFVIVLKIPLPVRQNLGVHLMGTALFLLLYVVGGQLCRIRPVNAVAQILGDLSYPVFLLHNQIIPRIAGSWQPGNPLKGLVLYAAVCLLSLAGGKALQVVTRAVMAWFDKKLAYLSEKKKSASRNACTEDRL